jgi:FlaA1/EpsC-like NDP-sugar epimerase
MRSLLRLALTYGHDVTMAAAAYLLALYLRLGDALFDWPRPVVVDGTLIFTGVAAVVFLALRLDRAVWRYASIGDLGRVLRAVALTVAVFVAIEFVLTRLQDFPRSALVIVLFVLTGLLAGPRFGYRLYRDGQLRSLLEHDGHQRVPVLLIGAGDGSDLFIREMSRERAAPFRVVGIVDDNDNRIGRQIRGVSVLAGIDGLADTIERLRRDDNAPQRLVITRAGIDGATVRRIIDVAERHGLAISRMPRLTAFDSADGSGQVSLRPVSVEDLLGRPQTVLDRESLSRLIGGRRVLVTGAGGTIGSELTRQVAALGPAEMVLVELSEFLLWQTGLEVAEAWPDLPCHQALADVRDRGAVDDVLRRFRPEIVFHAAALKHVPMVESHPLEGVLTNVVGTRNVADAARDAGVSAMVLISTDKAVNPSNVMGATKRLAEAYCQALDLECRASGGTRYVTVRFGNVLGSTGSVIPLFQRQLARGGPLTVTHPDMTRYFMTVREAVELVLHAAAMPDNAELGAGGICVLDMGEPVRIIDLARQMIRLAGLEPDRDIAIAFTGPRPGEKLHEELFHAAEPMVDAAVPGIRIARPRTADIAVLRRALDELEGAARDRQPEQTLKLLARLVPEFHEPVPTAGARGTG